MRRRKDCARLWRLNTNSVRVSNGSKNSRRSGGIIAITLAAALLLCSCNNKEPEQHPVEVEEQSLRKVTESIVYDNKELTKITPISSFELNEGELYVFPHFNKEEHITVKRIVISDNKLWTKICIGAKKTNNYMKDKKRGFTIVSHEGTSYGYYEINDEEAYLAVTSNLPSSYVRLIMKQLCSTGT